MRPWTDLNYNLKKAKIVLDMVEHLRYTYNRFEKKTHNKGVFMVYLSHLDMRAMSYNNYLKRLDKEIDVLLTPTKYEPRHPKKVRCYVCGKVTVVGNSCGC